MTYYEFIVQVDSRGRLQIPPRILELGPFPPGKEVRVRVRPVVEEGGRMKINHHTGYMVTGPKYDRCSRQIIDEQFSCWHRSFYCANHNAIQIRCSHPQPNLIKFVNIATGKELVIGTWPETEVSQ